MVIIALLLVVVAVLIGTAPLFFVRNVEPLPLDAAPYVRAEDVGATVYNLAVFFTVLVAATAIIYIFFTRRKWLNLLLYFIWFVLAVGVVQFYTILYYWSGLLNEDVAVKLMWASLLVGFLTVAAIHKRRGDLLLGFLGSLAGAMMVQLLPEMTVVALLVALPVYDYLMVTRGLLGSLIRKSKEAAGGGVPARGDTPLFGFVVRLKAMSLGVGDFVVYAMALTYVTVHLYTYGFIALLALVAGAALIYVGLRLTVHVFLRRWGYGPALPLPMLMLLPLIAAAWLA
ncbi:MULTISPECIES: hypothetical protein [Pyrobaculum]|uniref:Presenilin n=2 Tax=Pyrobaculum arsenaticum TaxID=121277 RepID=A4WIL0_PYRAR|nr:hypothetical protein [Pyrobaculum arsenaticum]ABP50227.1 conserved hypothetical protein [Pyrobaculum arsenaticum DSM 13514]MCY0889878.1 hypothetical protein [Pyrobaculum arsenaticum]NYR14836.1 hypothetical protein [Pyrobaculum arsenaticum]